MAVDLKLVPTSAEVRKAAIYEQLRFDSEPKNRLPADFIEAAAEAIAFEEMGITGPHEITGRYEEKTEIEDSIAARVEELTSAFQKFTFITWNDSKKDPYNDGQLLEFAIDLNETTLSDNQKPTAQKAIREKISWMGYVPFGKVSHDKFMSARQGVIKMTYPAYNR